MTAAKIGFIGLGLIGGSLAKAFKAYTDNRVYGCDADAATLAYAKLSETIDEPLTDEILPDFTVFNGMMDLSQIPSFNKFNLLLLIPLLTLIVTLGSTWLTRKMS